MSKELNVAIGGRIRSYRESKGLNREVFSEQIGLSPQFLAEVENGKKGLSAESIYKICTQCGLSADYLVLGNVNKQVVKTPLDNIIEEIPGDYSLQYAQVLKSINDVVNDVLKNAGERGKTDSSVFKDK